MTLFSTTPTLVLRAEGGLQDMRINQLARSTSFLQVVCPNYCTAINNLPP